MNKILGYLSAALLAVATTACNGAEGEVFKIGVIGATTSHVPAFVKTINDPKGDELYQGFEVTGVYPGGAPDNPDSWNRVTEYTEFCKDAGLTVYSTVEELVANVDGILLESVDGRLHLEQARPVFAAKKPIFIDKPIGGSLWEVLEIYRLAEEAGSPIFSSSSLRYVKAYQEAREGESSVGEILGADATSPAPLEPHHPSLYWYGIHGVESLFTVLGPECKSVSRTGTTACDVVVGIWDGKRVGTFRGIRKGAAPYSCRVFGENGMANVGDYEGYVPLVEQICKFFQSGVSPVDKEETINIYAFMTAADMSRREKGKQVELEEAIEEAEEEEVLTVELTTTAVSEVVWKDGENEKTVDYHDLGKLVEEALEEHDTVRYILDTRAGIPYDTGIKIMDQLSDARLANYLY